MSIGFNSLAKSFSHYVQLLDRNSKVSYCDNDREKVKFEEVFLKFGTNILDDPVGKTSAWWTALQIASQLVTISYQVITGINGGSSQLYNAQGVFMCDL